MDEDEFWAKWGSGSLTKRRDGMCPRCTERPRAEGDSYCRECRRAYQRAWMRANRPSHSDLSEEERAKARCRAYTRVLVYRGQIEKKPCITCGSKRFLEAHHEDYTNPRLVVWKCRRCHQEHREAETVNA